MASNPIPAKPVIAVVGAGPAGFYAAEALLQALPECRVHLIERGAAPHGLVRYGVAPDHQKLKQVAAVFDGIAGHERLRLHAGVDVGGNVSLDDIRARSHAVVLATGAPVGRSLGVPGEALQQVFSSAAFVGWYNGHADHTGTRPDLAVQSAVIVGNGNVALDVCRLMVRAYDDLAASDIPQPMLEVFRTRRIREVHLLGRGGPGAVKFTFKEFRQLADLPNVRIRAPQAAGFTETQWEQAAGPDAQRFLKWLRADSTREQPDPEGRTTVNLWFHLAPEAFLGDGRLGEVRVRSTAGGESTGFGIPCGIAVTCVGFSSRPLQGLPAADASGALGHRGGQVVGIDGHGLGGMFVAGWAKRGPSGIIGTNRACACETVAALVASLPALMASRPALAGDFESLFRARGIRSLGHADWQRLDAQECAWGEALGKPREKHLSMADALRTLSMAEAH